MRGLYQFGCFGRDGEGVGLFFRGRCSNPGHHREDASDYDLPGRPCSIGGATWDLYASLLQLAFGE